MNMKYFTNPKISGCILIITGVIIAVISLSADLLGVGGWPPVIGPKQWGGAVLGLVLVFVGIIFAISHFETVTDQLGRKIYDLWINQQTHLVTFTGFCLGLFWLVFIYRAGIFMSADSTWLMKYAMDIHYAFEFPNDTNWPPLYPFLINLFMYINEFPAEAAALLSGVSILIFFVVFALILRKFCEDILINCLFLITMFTFTKFLYLHEYACTEVPFSLFIILNVYFVIIHNETKKLKYYIIAACCASLATLTRYTGYYLIAVFFIYTLFFLFINRLEKGVSVKKYILWNSVTYIPIFLYSISVDFFYSRLTVAQFFKGRWTSAWGTSTERTIFQCLYQVLNTLEADMSFYLLVMLIISLSLYFFAVKRDRALENKFVLPLSYILFVGLIYIAMFIYTASKVHTAPIGTRYLSPVYPCFFLFAFISFNSALHLKTEDKKYEHFSRYSLKIVLYTLILATLIVHLKSFAYYMDNISKKESRNSYLASGFNSTPATKEFNNYFKDILSKQDVLHVLFIFGYAQRAQEPIKNFTFLERAFLFRKGFIKNSAFSSFSFEFLKEDKDNWSDFMISFRSDGHEKSIVHCSVPPHIKNEDQLIEGLRRILVKKNTDSLCLIVYRGGRPAGQVVYKKDAAETDLSQFITEGIKIISQIDIAPYYTIYKLGLAS